MPRPASSYRAARRNRCRLTSIVIWRPRPGPGTPVDGRPKYGNAALREIRAAKGVGRPPQ